jgi:hypothetical protein
MLKLLDHVTARPTSNVFTTRWDNQLSVKVNVSPDPNTYDMAMMSQYMMEVRFGRTFTCKKGDYDHCFERGIKAMQRDLYDEMLRPLFALESAVYEEDSVECRRQISIIRSLVEG